MKKLKNKNGGITLIALVITIIILLILATVTITTLTGDNGLFRRAKEAKSETENAQIKERIQLAYIAAIAYGKGELTEANLKTALTQEFGAEGTGFKLKDNETSWEVEIIEKGVKETIAKTSNSQAKPETNPAIKYGYVSKEGIVEASTLKPGDVINYYYDVEKSPIVCVVLYGSESENGLQVVSLNSVREVALGFDDDDTTKRDPKAIEAFEDKNNDGEEDAPEGYTVSNFEKARWSYNNAIATLNGYAQNYLGDMAISARCVGTPVGVTETTNMFTADPSDTYLKDYNGLFKDTDNNVDDFEGDGIVNEDLNKMHELNVIAVPGGGAYWVSSRRVGYVPGWSNLGAEFYVLFIEFDGVLDCQKKSKKLGAVYSDLSTHNGGDLFGFRPIFVLKSDIQVEKIVDSEEFQGPGGFFAGLL